MGVGRGFPASAATATGSTGLPASPEPSLLPGYLVDSPDRRGMAISTRRVSFALHLLAASQAVGRRRRVAECGAHCWGGLDQEGLLKWDEVFLDDVDQLHDCHRACAADAYLPGIDRSGWRRLQLSSGGGGRSTAVQVLDHQRLVAYGADAESIDGSDHGYTDRLRDVHLVRPRLWIPEARQPARRRPVAPS